MSEFRMAPLVLGNCLSPTCSAGKGARLRLYTCKNFLTGLVLMESQTGKSGNWPQRKRSKESCCVPGLTGELQRQGFKNQALDKTGFQSLLDQKRQSS